MYQQITLAGNLGADPEMRYTPSGTPVTSFRMAVSRTWTKDGEKLEKTTWFRVTAWQKLAEIASQYLAKGSKVLVIGEMEDANAYLDKAGKPAATLEVTAKEIKFLSSKGQDNGNAPTPAPAQQPQRQAETVDDSIPF